MKNKTFLDSIKCALYGLYYALKTEKNYKYYIFIATFFLCLNIYFKVELSGYLAHIITTCGVFSSECLNTSIEHFIDKEDKEIKLEIKLIKDIAAAGVICWGFAFFICEAVILLNAIF